VEEAKEFKEERKNADEREPEAIEQSGIARG
jgi:hypothetical protein